jgi:phosphoribosyl 1,2-cyclic phosphodiesterase
MNLKIIGSNSKGNSYILGDDNSALLIECGVKFSKIKEALDFNISKVDACLVTHEHYDHALSIRDIQNSGIPIVASSGTMRATGTVGNDGTIKHAEIVQIKEWEIQALKIDHDAAEPLAFIIEHKSCGRVLFVTDTYILRYKFDPLFDYVIIEANYCAQMADKWRQSKGVGFVEDRRLKNHMSYQTALTTLERMDLSKCKKIVLIHLSDGLTNEKQFINGVEEGFGIPTYCAAPGMELSFNLNPY